MPIRGSLDLLCDRCGAKIRNISYPILPRYRGRNYCCDCQRVLSALSHIGALALWPTMMLAYHGTVARVSGDGASSVLTVLDFLVWIVPFGVLMLIPVRWRMRDNEALV